MLIRYEITEEDGKLCFVETELHTGKRHYYPIRAKIETSFNPNMSMFLPDPYLYVDRENEE